jgi:hypothetical protein
LNVLGKIVTKIWKTNYIIYDKKEYETNCFLPAKKMKGVKWNEKKFKNRK